MDVRCGRCGTEYEFDDALISERGTTVKCTNCGYQFKVFPDAAAAAPERWVVRTVAGRELVYTTLKDLQRGIAKGHVSADDMLSRGNRPARPLSAIPELEPFLRSNAGTLPQRRTPRTLQGVAPAANASAGGDEPPSRGLPQQMPSTAPSGARPQSLTPAWDQPRQAPREALRSDAPTIAGGVAAPQARSVAPRSDAPTVSRAAVSDAPSTSAGATQSAPSAPSSFRYPSSAPTVTMPGGVSLTAPTVKRTPPGGTGLLHDLKPPPAVESARAAQSGRFDAVEPPTIPRYLTGPDLASHERTAAAQEPPAPAPPARLPAREIAAPQPTPELTAPQPVARAPEPPTPSLRDSSARGAGAPEAETDRVARGLKEARALLQHDDQTDPHYVTSATRRNARSRWLVLVVVLGAGVLLAGTVGKRYFAKYTKGQELAASRTDATVASLITEGERLLARGQLEGAKEAFGKASARAEKDPQVVTSLATLEVVQADLSWLKQRLLEGGDATAAEQTRRELARQVVSVRGAVERTRLLAPEAATTARLLVHMKRLGGEVT
ncbi:MAG TPA: zinc-ribbon domain-containing protein, partial [Polyangiaceae bacterium]